jgi:hypothetical protein
LRLEWKRPARKAFAEIFDLTGRTALGAGIAFLLFGHSNAPEAIQWAVRLEKEHPRIAITQQRES